MTGEEAYSVAARIKALGLSYFPRSPETLTELGKLIAPLNSDQGDDLIAALSQWSQWDMGKFSRCVAAFTSTRPRPAYEPEPPPPYTLDDVAQAERDSLTVPDTHPLYRKTSRQWVKAITEQFGAGHVSTVPPLLDKNVRIILAGLILAGKLKPMKPPEESPNVPRTRKPGRPIQHHTRR